MSTLPRTFLTVLVTASLAACAAPQERTAPSAGVSGLPGNNSTSGMVMSGADLYEYGGNLLSFLYSRVSGMEVEYATQPCPSVRMRGRKSIMGSSNPVVYVDGARTANSCVLDMLLTRDLTRVEVYPMGVANRPGYEANPNGLILVFLRNGPDLSSRSRATD